MKKSLKKVRQRVRQGAGKVRRFANHKLRKEYVKQQLEKRQGECLRCGACCKLMFKCPLLIESEDGCTACRVHRRRPENCRIFPLDRRDLEERDHLNPLVKCGYWFDDDDSDDDSVLSPEPE